MQCDKSHRYNTMFKNLPNDQSGNGRHKCAGCAYEKGRQDALQKNVLIVDLNDLPESQAGTIRHKNPIAAYAQGLLDAIYGVYSRIESDYDEQDIMRDVNNYFVTKDEK